MFALAALLNSYSQAIKSSVPVKDGKGTKLVSWFCWAIKSASWTKVSCKFWAILIGYSRAGGEVGSGGELDIIGSVSWSDSVFSDLKRPVKPCWIFLKVEVDWSGSVGNSCVCLYSWHSLLNIFIFLTNLSIYLTASIEVDSVWISIQSLS